MSTVRTHFKTRLLLIFIISFLFAIVNYRLVWRFDAPFVGEIRREDEEQSVFGLAPPKHQASAAPNRFNYSITSRDVHESLHDNLLNNGTESQNKQSLEKLVESLFAHKPAQKRTGRPWDGWPNSPSDEESNNDNWWRKSKMCFEVHNICHHRATNTWFYYEPENESRPDLFQPTMELRSEALKYDRGQSAEKRINITVDASSKVKDATFGDNSFQYDGGTCQISRIPIHMAVQSLFNYMIGEFYVRTLLPLHLLMTSNTTGNTDASVKPWEQDIQFYVHLSHGGQTLFDGHKLLLSGMLSRENAAVAKSMLDLFTLDGLDQDDASDCECFETMVFCGYDVYKNYDLTREELSMIGINDANNVASSNIATPDSSLKYTLWNAANTAGDLERTGYCGNNEIINDSYSCHEWAHLRTFLLSNLMNHYPSLENDVYRFRKDVLVRKHFIDTSYNGTTEEWTFVGLAQRSYRRSWLNLPQVMDKCNSLYQEKQMKVVCVEINVEKTLSPYEQLILHRAVNALIGVHGAQMTQAVLLPPHGNVLELLPWVPENYNIRGLWVQTRDVPTPQGVIFHNSDLNHIGYSLGRDSVPLCEGVGDVGSDEEKKCLTSGENRKQFLWEMRDFNVNPGIILQYIERLLLVDYNTECSKLTENLDKDFVLYNVWCVLDHETDVKKISPFDSKLSLQHYYDSKPDEEEKNEAALSLASQRIEIDAPTQYIDIVSLTVESDFFTLFNSSAITSWIHYIQNVRSITFIGPSDHYSAFKQNMDAHNASIFSSSRASSIRISWVNETHWITRYKSKYRCVYHSACQQMIKLHVFDLRTHLGLSYIGDNILIVDSDTVWSREVTFIHPNNTVTYFERIFSDENEHNCDGRDPVRFTEAITIGSAGKEVANEDADEYNFKHTKTPYVACRRQHHPNATGARHIVHHMLFQHDVMENLHNTITQAWKASSLWQAVTMCHKYPFCTGRVAEFELYYAFLLSFYPERIHVKRLTPGKDWMNSAICDDKEMKCCRKKNVLLKGCHDHRIKNYKNGADPGDMCCAV